MNIEGKLTSIGETQTFGSNGFRKREVVITTEEQYPQPIMVEFVQDKCDLLNAYNEGEKVIIDINLRGREWVNPQGETKYFNSIQGWRIVKVGGDDKPATNEPIQDSPFPTTDNINEEGKDDLPF